MKFIIKLSLKYVERQKFRTVLTFLGVMLAAFIMGISLFSATNVYKAFMNYWIKEIGSWELILGDDSFSLCDDREQAVKTISENVLTSSYYVCSDKRLRIPAKGEKIAADQYFEVECNGEVLFNTGMIIQSTAGGNSELQGEYPVIYVNQVENSDGIVISTAFCESGVKKGDRITVTVTPVNGEKRGISCSENFVVEGFSEDLGSRNFIMLSVSEDCSFAEDIYDANRDIIEGFSESTEMLIQINDNVKFEEAVNSIFDSAFDGKLTLDKLITENEDECLNNMVLFFKMKYLGDPSNFGVIAALVFAFIFLVWMVTRFIIDNTFEISVSERNRKYNVLKILGASKGQLAALTATEACFYSLTSVPLGIILSVIIVKNIFRMFREAGAEIGEISVYPAVVASIIILCVISVFISAYTSALWPTRKMTLVNAMNYGLSVKNKKMKNKKRKLHKSPSGLIRTYTGRNIARTKGKFIFSVFAGSVSVIMLVVMVMEGLLLKDTLKSENSDAVDYGFYYVRGVTYSDAKADFDNSELFSDLYMTAYNSYSRAEFNSNNIISSECAERIDTISGMSLKDYRFGLISEDSYNADVQNTFDEVWGYEPKNISSISDITGLSYEKFRESGKSILVVFRNGVSDFRKLSGSGAVVKAGSEEYTINGICYINAGKGTDSLSTTGYIFKASENLTDAVFSDATIKVKFSDAVHHDECIEICENFSRDYEVSYASNSYLYGTGMKQFTDAIIKTALIFFVFLWLTGIISMINLTNTRIINSQREYFIFRCSGMTRKQLVKSVILEVVIFSVLSTVTGLVLGILFFSGLTGTMASLSTTSDEMLREISKLYKTALFPLGGLSAATLISNIFIPVLFAFPLIKKLFTTSSDAVNTNVLR